MRLDVVIPTYNRSGLLRLALRSLAAAESAPELGLEVFVVDNNSRDDTRQVVEAEREPFGARLHYLFEPRQGRSHALNTGIAAGSGDLVGMVDDDEEVDRRWLQVIADYFRDPAVDFIGGPYTAKLTSAPPPWLPPDYPAVIGHIPGRERHRFAPDSPHLLMGGNAILRRELLARMGPYNTSLGRTATGLLSGEDHDMYDRLMASGARGWFVPDLVVLHHVPPERLTKLYHRRWAFWHGVSMGRMDVARPQRVPYFAGVPRYMFGDAVRGLLRNLLRLGRRAGHEATLFSHELKIWGTVGFAYGKLGRRSGRRAAT